MKKLLFIAAFLFNGLLYAQHLEVGMMLGVSDYHGDLSPKSLKGSFSELHLGFGGFGRYNINNYFAARAQLSYGRISANDANSSDKAQQERNLSFRSNLLELGLIGEFHFPGFQPYGLYQPFSPYVFAGIAFYKYNPKTTYDNQTVELRDLGTEGQGMAQFPERDKYNLTGFSIPFGAGVKWAITDKFVLGLEVGIRKTFNDYLDDVSTTYVAFDEILAGNGELAAQLSNRSATPKATGEGRGDAGNKDLYMFYGLTVSYNFLDNGLMRSRKRTKRKRGCPGQF